MSYDTLKPSALSDRVFGSGVASGTAHAFPSPSPIINRAPETFPPPPSETRMDAISRELQALLLQTDEVLASTITVRTRLIGLPETNVARPEGAPIDRQRHDQGMLDSIVAFIAQARMTLISTRAHLAELERQTA